MGNYMDFSPAGIRTEMEAKIENAILKFSDDEETACCTESNSNINSDEDFGFDAFRRKYIRSVSNIYVDMQLKGILRWLPESYFPFDLSQNPALTKELKANSMRHHCVDS